MSIKNSVSSDFFYPRLLIVKSVFNCRLSGVMLLRVRSGRVWINEIKYGFMLSRVLMTRVKAFRIIPEFRILRL